MELTTLSGTIFCGASWANIEIEVIGSSKEECLKHFLNQCQTIDLLKTNILNPSTIFSELVSWKESHPDLYGKFGINAQYELFKVNPEKYINLSICSKLFV